MRRSSSTGKRYSRVARSILSVILPGMALTACAVPLPDEMTLQPDDRILVMAPHPDDEVIGCGGVIQHALAMNLPVRVVFLTNGDNNEWSFWVYRHHPVIKPSAVRQMGEIRHDEAIRADAALGLSSNVLSFLGYPDFGTLSIWNSHWGRAPVFKSMLTRVTAVPYVDAFRPGAPYKGEEVIKDITSILREFKPTRIFLSHPADFHFDHLSLYLFTRVALWDLEPELQPAPTLHPYLVHFRRWPQPRGLHLDAPWNPPDFFSRQIQWQSLPLTSNQMAVKHAAIEKHKTQFEYASGYLLSFVKTRELFGDFPVVNLSSAVMSEVDLAQGQGPSTSDGGMPEQLTDEERNRFVGIEWRTVRLDGGDLVITIDLSRPLAEMVSATVFAFGYRRDVSFEYMPKLQIQLGPLEHEVLDQGTKLSSDTVAVNRHLRSITLRIPLKVLRQPEKVLISARTYFGEVPLDWVSWRALELKPAPSRAATTP